MEEYFHSYSQKEAQAALGLMLLADSTTGPDIMNDWITDFSLLSKEDEDDEMDAFQSDDKEENESSDKEEKYSSDEEEDESFDEEEDFDLPLEETVDICVHVGVPDYEEENESIEPVDKFVNVDLPGYDDKEDDPIEPVDECVDEDDSDDEEDDLTELDDLCADLHEPVDDEEEEEEDESIEPEVICVEVDVPGYSYEEADSTVEDSCEEDSDGDDFEEDDSDEEDSDEEDSEEEDSDKDESEEEDSWEDYSEEEDSLEEETVVDDPIVGVPSLDDFDIKAPKKNNPHGTDGYVDSSYLSDFYEDHDTSFYEDDCSQIYNEEDGYEYQSEYDSDSDSVVEYEDEDEESSEDEAYTNGAEDGKEFRKMVLKDTLEKMLKRMTTVTVYDRLRSFWGLDEEDNCVRERLEPFVDEDEVNDVIDVGFHFAMKRFYPSAEDRNADQQENREKNNTASRLSRIRFRNAGKNLRVQTIAINKENKAIRMQNAALVSYMECLHKKLNLDPMEFKRPVNQVIDDINACMGQINTEYTVPHFELLEDMEFAEYYM